MAIVANNNAKDTTINPDDAVITAAAKDVCKTVATTNAIVAITAHAIVVMRKFLGEIRSPIECRTILCKNTFVAGETILLPTSHLCLNPLLEDLALFLFS